MDDTFSFTEKFLASRINRLPLCFQKLFWSASIEPKASWKISKNSKGFSLVIRTFATKTVTPLKDGQSASGCQQESHADKTTDDLLLKKPKRKYNSPSTVARDRARSLRFWKNFKNGT